MKRVAYIIFIFSFLFIQKWNAQGCSDPGICTIGSLNSATSADTVSQTDFTTADINQLLNTAVLNEKFNIAGELGYGIGDQSTNIYSFYLRGTFRIKEKLMLGVKIPYTITDGVLGNAQGLGDITVNLQNVIMSGRNYRLAYTLGVVIPTNDANLKSNGKSLPMVYQTSMGFYGALAGITVSTRRWNAVLGFQQNFGRNQNEFTNENITLDPSLPAYDTLNRQRLNFGSSRQINNTGDIILRVERQFNIKKISILAGLLPIYRIGNSTIKLLNGDTYEVDKTNGLTLNVTAGVSYRINRKWLLGVNVGKPFINRTVAPDGLRREGVFLIRITKKFW